jgi:hypothetical protein
MELFCFMCAGTVCLIYQFRVCGVFLPEGVKFDSVAPERLEILLLSRKLQVRISDWRQDSLIEVFRCFLQFFQ